MLHRSMRESGGTAAEGPLDWAYCAPAAGPARAIEAVVAHGVC